jgi:hypothetical protein
MFSWKNWLKTTHWQSHALMIKLTERTTGLQSHALMINLEEKPHVCKVMFWW